MSEVKRLGYKSATSNQLVEVEFKKNSLVRYADYEKLEKENQELREKMKEQAKELMVLREIEKRFIEIRESGAKKK